PHPHGAGRRLQPPAASRVTLRLRLVLALVGLVLVGLVAFGFTTYSVYAKVQYDRLDDQIRTSVPFVSRELSQGDGDGGGPGHGPGRGPGGGHGHDDAPPSGLPAATYAEVRDEGNNTVSVLQPDTSAKPRLPNNPKAGIFT